MKSRPGNVSQMRNGGNAYLQCVIAIQSIQRPEKLKEKLDELTLESRIPGETWRDVEDHG